MDLCPAVNSYDFGRTHRYSHPFCLSFLLSERKFPAIDVCPSFFCSLSLSLPPFLLLEGSCTRKRACNRRWINSICLVNRLAYRGKRCSRFNLYGSYEGVNYPRHRGARLPPIDPIPPTFFPITTFFPISRRVSPPQAGKRVADLGNKPTCEAKGRKKLPSKGQLFNTGCKSNLSSPLFRASFPRLLSFSSEERRRLTQITGEEREVNQGKT